MHDNFTVVTNCNQDYFWGAYLLAASLRFENIQAPVHVLAMGIDAKSRQLLEQFSGVRVFDPDKSNPRNPTNLKPQALLTADTEYIGWFDSDCVVIGDITKYWIPANDSFQSRFRSGEDTAIVYRTKFAPGEKAFGIPKGVLDVWRKDVGENEANTISATCTADNFVFHRRHLNFIKRWDEQLKRVIPAEDQGVVNHSSFAYRQTDEEVMNSVIAFSRSAPPIDGQYLLDKDPKAFVLHCGMLPKPWQGWQYRFLPYYDHIVGIVEWAQKKGYQTPPLPRSLQRRYKLASRLAAMAGSSYSYSKGVARHLLKV
jgi:hypothetical protein